MFVLLIKSFFKLAKTLSYEIDNITSKGVYLLELDTDLGIVNKKLILQ